MAKKQSARRDELKSMTESQLKDELVKLKKEQFNLRFQTATGQVEKTHTVRVVRRNIATVKTLLRGHATQSAE
ncbi:MAG: 50S ribosomal protein L29 [Pseudomonadota bacterium]